MNYKFKQFTGATSTLAYQVPALRARYGLNQREVASEAGLHEGELGKIERGLIPTTDEYAQWLLDLVEDMHRVRNRVREEVSV